MAPRFFSTAPHARQTPASGRPERAEHPRRKCSRALAPTARSTKIPRSRRRLSSAGRTSSRPAPACFSSASPGAGRCDCHDCRDCRDCRGCCDDAPQTATARSAANRTSIYHAAGYAATPAMPATKTTTGTRTSRHVPTDTRAARATSLRIAVTKLARETDASGRFERRSSLKRGCSVYCALLRGRTRLRHHGPCVSFGKKRPGGNL
mmetsp:Transcript_11265/g.31539  ORF Transcript_11265/g.31539 Transcript_11265/m.31539 type:complete len:207 (-) Transcript_11265:140-760(-)